MKTQIFKFIIFTALVNFAVACSESSSPTTVGSGAGLSVSIKYASGNSITASSNATVSFTLRNSAGVVIENAIITLTTTLATLATASVLTDSSGNASVVISSLGTSGADSIKATVTADNTTYTAELGYQVDLTTASATNSLVLKLTNSSGVTIDTVTSIITGTLKATILNSNNIVVAGQIVSFTTTSGTLNTSSAITDSSGIATIFITPGSTSGAGTVTATATINSTAVSSSLAYSIISSAPPNITLALKDGSANTITAVRVDLEGVVTATLTNDSGKLLANKIVQFATKIASLNPSSGSVLTNSSGVATIKLVAGNTISADSLTATVVEGTVTTVQTLNYSVDAPKIRLGNGNGTGTGFTESILAVNNATISAGGTGSFTATLVDSTSTLVTESYDVQFTSSCSGSNLATIDAQVTTTNGSAVATYQANGCTGSDVITATVSIGGQVFTAAKTITISSDTAGSIQFVSASPTNIALKGTGGVGRQEFSNVVFKVIGATGLALANTSVTFSLNTQIGGITLLSSSVTTNNAGEATAVVQSGNVSTPVRVTAQVTVGSNTISSQSDQLTISTGLTDQNSIQISADKLAPEADFVGTKVLLTVNAADAFNHSVPDGTAVLVVTEGGAIQDANNTCLTVNGSCTVTWVSQNPRPVDNRSTVMAYILGTESFADKNGNGVYDDGDTFTDLPETYLDADESSAFSGTGGVWSGILDTTRSAGYNLTASAFTTYDFSGNESFFDIDGSKSFSTGDTKFNGVTCSHTTNCPTATTNYSGRFVHVRDSLVLVMAESSPLITITADNGTTLFVSGRPSTTTGATKVVTDGNITSATLSAGSLSEGEISSGTLTSAATITTGIVTEGAINMGTLTGVTISGGTTAGTTVTGATVVATGGTGITLTVGVGSGVTMTGVTGASFAGTSFIGTGIRASSVFTTNSKITGGTTTDTTTSNTITGGTTTAGIVSSGDISTDANISVGTLNSATLSATKLNSAVVSGMTITGGTASSLVITDATIDNTTGAITAGAISAANFTAGSVVSSSFTAGNITTATLTSAKATAAKLTGTITGSTTLGETTIGGSINGKAVSTSYRFTINIKDPKVLCLSADKKARVNAITPDDALCKVTETSSAPTGSAVAVSSGVGTLSTVSVTTIASKVGQTEFQVTVKPAADNDEAEVGLLEVLVTTPNGVVTSKSITLSDPIN